MANTQYDEFIRIRITELRIAKEYFEHKMSLIWIRVAHTFVE